MDLLNKTNMQILAVLVVAVAIKLFIDHRKAGYAGPYNPQGAYPNISSTKHDTTKALWVDLFVLMALGLATGDRFYDSDNIMGSWVGKALVTIAAFFTYHEFIQPYVVNKLPYF